MGKITFIYKKGSERNPQGFPFDELGKALGEHIPFDLKIDVYKCEGPEGWASGIVGPAYASTDSNAYSFIYTPVKMDGDKVHMLGDDECEYVFDIPVLAKALIHDNWFVNHEKIYINDAVTEGVCVRYDEECEKRGIWFNVVRTQR